MFSNNREAIHLPNVDGFVLRMGRSRLLVFWAIKV
jgi:hypothetical protein